MLGDFMHMYVTKRRAVVGSLVVSKNGRLPIVAVSSCCYSEINFVVDYSPASYHTIVPTTAGLCGWANTCKEIRHSIVTLA